MEKYVVIKKAESFCICMIISLERPASINLKIWNLREQRGGTAEDVCTCAGIFTQFFTF